MYVCNAHVLLWAASPQPPTSNIIIYFLELCIRLGYFCFFFFNYCVLSCPSCGCPGRVKYRSSIILVGLTSRDRQTILYKSRNRLFSISAGRDALTTGGMGGFINLLLNNIKTQQVESFYGPLRNVRFKNSSRGPRDVIECQAKLN